MRGDDAFGQWAELESPSSDLEWVAQPLGDSHFRIAKTSEGGAALLIPSEIAGVPNSGGEALRTSHVSYSPRRHLTVRGGSQAVADWFAVLACEESDPELVRYFLRIADALLATEGDEVSMGADTAIRQLFELFRAMSRPSIRTLQGLWGELVLVAHARDPDAIVESWHSAPSDVHDFIGFGARLEVKTTSTGLREHEFSLAQLLHAQGQTYVASMMLEHASEGGSLFDLLDQLLGRIEKSGLRRRAETIVADSLGASWRGVEDVRFDVSGALDSTRVIRSGDVPRVPEGYPPTVKAIRFRADVAACAPLSVAECGELPLLSSLCPLAR